MSELARNMKWRLLSRTATVVIFTPVNVGQYPTVSRCTPEEWDSGDLFGHNRE